MCKNTSQYSFFQRAKVIHCGSSSNRLSNPSYNFNAKVISDIGSIDDSSVEIADASDTKKEETEVQECCICLEQIGADVYFTYECDHSACRECMRKYLNRATSDPRYESYEYIYCPGSNCDSKFVTGDLLARIFTEKDDGESWWSRALTRVFMQNPVVCPFDDCDELFDADLPDLGECVFAECQGCHRGFCLGCRKKWHAVNESNISENVKEATEMLENIMLTAEQQNWTRCPNCKNMVEKKTGCDHISCRCGTQFCYRCGSLYRSNGCVSECTSYDLKTLQSIRKPMFYVDRFDRNRNNQH